jgi:ferredoxin--NADP+ reductase
MTTAHTPEIDLTPVKMHLHAPNAPAVGRVVNNQRCTASKKSAGFVRHVAIDVSGTQLAGNFRAGQSFGVIPPGLDANSKPHKLRLYSIASPSAGEDGKGLVLATTVKRTIDEHWESHRLFLGVCSNYLADLQIGDAVQVTGPAGKRFVLPARPDEHDYLFFATGTGIAPFRGMLMELLASSPQSSITLVMGSPYATDLLYHEDLLKLAANHPRFRYIPTLSRERQHDSLPPMYVQDRIAANRDFFAPLLSSSRTLIYICGLAGMELGILRAIASSLPDSPREQYLQADRATIQDVANWTRTMLHKQVRVSRRVFLEVY